ncbi:MAG: DUF1592 domain-containing protein [Planctomycetota bacterium]
MRDNTFLGKYCADCHSDGISEGGFDLERLEAELSDPAQFATWQRVFDRIDSGEMPPEDSDTPDRNEQSKFLQSVGRNLHKQHERIKGTVLRRLNRREYENTLNDLFGTELQLEGMLPVDAKSHEFDNVGEALGISMVHLQQYLTAIDLVLEDAIAKEAERPEQKTVDANYVSSREGPQFIGKFWKKLDDNAVVFFQRMGYPTGMLRGTEVKPPGRYKIRVRGYAYQSENPVTFRIGGTSFLRGSEKITHGYASFQPGEAQTVELESYIPNRYMIELDPWEIDTGSYNIRKQGIEDYDGPGLAILNVELEGPLVDQFPSRGHTLLFEGFERKALPKRNKWQKETYFQLTAEDEERAAKNALQRIAKLAFRRPVNADEIDRYLDLFLAQRMSGEELESALKTAVAGLFCSPDFIYFAENTGWLNDHALANRLSYFLSRSLPDGRLTKLADQGKFANSPENLLAETRRLLAEHTSARFIHDFCDAWLNLRDIEFTSPDKSLYPEWDNYLLHSMLKETRAYVRKLFEDNLPIDRLVQSDFAMLNDRLARHYGIEGVSGPEIRAVQLPSDSLRGGLLSQASILKVSANGTNTSPVVRGVWVMERILGNPPQPPPPGISGVEPDIRGATTLRELLEKHRALDSCRGCHAAIDPPGFALEEFNAIGGFRERFRSLGEGERVDLQIRGQRVRYRLGQNVDASGELASGTSFQDFREFRTLLADDKESLAKAFVEKLLTFATGRELGFSDRPIVTRIVADCSKNGYRVRDLLEQVILSEAFRRK